VTPDKEERRRAQHRRARELRRLAEECLRDLFAWLALWKLGLASEEDCPLPRLDPEEQRRPFSFTYDAQCRLTCIAEH
jgi:hypothetical protein